MPSNPDVWPDAMRMDADGDAVAAFDRCEGECHEVGYDGCFRCCSLLVDLVCLDCLSYLASDAEVSS